MLSVPKMPLWARYLVCFVVTAALITAVVVYVDDHQSPLVESPVAPSKAQLATEEQQDYTLVQQQQAPQTATLPAHSTPLSAIASAVGAYMANQVNTGAIGGPLQGPVTCQATGGSAARARFYCFATANSLTYPFDGVVQPPAARITYCEVVAPPIPSMHVPLSSRCL